MTNQRAMTSHAGEASPAGPAALSSSRRDLLRVSTAALALGTPRLRFPAAAGAQESASPVTDVCVLTPEQTEGPFYLPLDLLRADITEGQPGLPLRLRVTVADLSTGCAPLADAAVDLWHCNAQGFYSGVAARPGGGADPEAAAGAEAGTFLRGIQLTDGSGIAEFATIYPGWYAGRAVHIHMKVHVGGTREILELPTPAADATFDTEGGEVVVVHTGQIYFEDAVSDEVFETVEAYGGRDNAQRLRNDQDSILGDQASEPGFIVSLTPLTEGSPGDGFLGEIIVGVMG